MKLIKRKAYKILAVLILLYVIGFGMLVPLRPGIMKIDTFRAEMGTTATLLIDAYNSTFTKSDDHRIWMRLDNEHFLKAHTFEVVNDRQLKATFDIPENPPFDQRVVPASIILDNSFDGTMVLPDALSLVGDDNYTVQPEPWLLQPISDLNMRWAYAFPWRNILEETIRNTYFHVPLWFGMVLIFLLSAIYSIKLIRTDNSTYESRIFSLNLIGTVYGLLGIFTGAVWARYTWGAYWSGDIKQDMAAICLLIFFAYFLLRSSMPESKKRDRITAAYTIFAFVAIIPLLYIIPRMQPSLHPGSGGNPGFGGEDLDNTMRTIFYPAVIGWTIFAYWLSDIIFRIKEIDKKLKDRVYG